MKYPENERILIVRPCLKTICLGVKPAAKLLSALLYHARNCSDEEPSFTIQWTQEQVTRAVCEEFTSKTLHDTAIPCLELLGYLDVDTSSYVYQYTLHLDLIHRALEVYSTPVELEKFLIACIRSQLEKLLNELEKLPNQLEEVLNELEKLLIVIRKTSNSKRGRKARTQAGSEAISENTRLLEIDKITKREEESEGEQQENATIAPSLSLGAALSSSSQSIENESQQRILTLLCLHAIPRANPSVEQIVVMAETKEAWQGYPLGQPDHEISVQYLKSGWKLLHAEGDAHGLANNDLADMALDHTQHLPVHGSVVQAEAAPEIDEEWCTADTEARLPAIPKQTFSLSSAVEPGRSGGPTPAAPASLPGGASPEQNRDAIFPRSVAVEVDSGCTAPASAPQVPPGATPPRTMRATVVSPDLPVVKPKPARRRKGELDEVTQKRVESVIAYLDALKQEVMEDAETKYRPSQKDTQAIVEVLLPQNPSEKRVRRAFYDMWNEADRNGNHFWRKHMTIYNFCNQYESRIMGLEGKDKRDSKETPPPPIIHTLPERETPLVIWNPAKEQRERRAL